MTGILFVCHGNICRSPMAEYVMKDLAARRGLSDRFFLDSAATSTEELGNPVYPPARRELERMGVPCGGHRARQLTPEDYRRFDLLVGMEQRNLRNMLRILGTDPEGKCRLLLPGRDISDPWYSGDFHTTYRDVLAGCTALLEEFS